MTHDSVTGNNVAITSNLCQGSAGHGFVLPFIPCDNINSSPYSDNTVGSAQIGSIFNKIEGTCIGAANIKAYAC